MSVKEHVYKNKKTYVACGLTAITVAGITMLVMRPRIGSAIGGAAGPAVGGTGQSGVSNFISPVNVGGKTTVNLSQVIEAHRQGPPSWVVRCLETGEAWASQRSAALANGLQESHLSSHLNGLRDHVNGLHFERVCLAA